ncbi:MAG: hypothetical protein OD811_05345 [Alphaproteobacteria bacterium]
MRRFLEGLVRRGTLHCAVAGRSDTLIFGDGSLPEVKLIFHEAGLVGRLAFHPVLTFVGGYMDGEINSGAGESVGFIYVDFSEHGERP